ncbi:MAG: hypothetical protein V1489_02620 [Candidatus Liptonbacteria bacterium]
METHYYCKRCDEFFVENKLPNINKKHTCGGHARIVEHQILGKKEK